MSAPGPCKGITGRLFGHKFRPRYDEKSSMPPGQVDFGTWLSGSRIVFAPDVIRELSNLATTEQIYVHDVCVRCGQIVHKQPDP